MSGIDQLVGIPYIDKFLLIGMIFCIPTKLSLGEGLPSVDYKESDKKDNQISISGHSYNLKVLRRGPFLHYKSMSLRRGPSFTLKIEGFKTWAPLLLSTC